MTYLPGTARNRFVRLVLLQQLAEAVKVDIWQPVPPVALSAGQARTVILFPPDAFSFWLNNEGELVKLVHIGIQSKEPV
ncbi:Uncharacterised protein [Pantoea agglomerans]|uniref:Uncharacterized protein n=1 Tax=Enterobacter agglomerans TaxID=549 RepID=A0A379ADR8_ENTAG|nr:Uncharacterised protein [Pantoea agglomerans]